MKKHQKAFVTPWRFCNALDKIIWEQFSYLYQSPPNSRYRIYFLISLSNVVQSKLVLTGRRIDHFSELWCLVASRGSYIWVSSVGFQKRNIGWLQKPLTERFQKNVPIHFKQKYSKGCLSLFNYFTDMNPTLIEGKKTCFFNKKLSH